MAHRPYPDLSTETVSDAFTRQYYNIWVNFPEQIHGFYKDSSRVVRFEDDGTWSVTTTKGKIKEKLQGLRRLCNWRSLHMETVDARERSCNGGVSIVVTGDFTDDYNQRKKFIQNFLLAQQPEGGYFLESDVLNIYPDI